MTCFFSTKIDSTERMLHYWKLEDQEAIVWRSWKAKRSGYFLPGCLILWCLSFQHTNFHRFCAWRNWRK